MALVVTGLKNHPGKWLRVDAAASLERFERDHGVFDVNSAGRSPGEQQALINRWIKGGAANRPPNLFKPAPVGTSPHEQGTAVDSDTPMVLANHPEYGWYRNLPTTDPVHLVYDPARDRMKSSTAGGGGTPIEPEKKDEDDDMYVVNDVNGSGSYVVNDEGVTGILGGVQSTIWRLQKLEPGQRLDLQKLEIDELNVVLRANARLNNGTLDIPALVKAIVAALPASGGGSNLNADQIATAVVAKLGAALTGK